jgi:hypothetical protein
MAYSGALGGEGASCGISEGMNRAVRTSGVRRSARQKRAEGDSKK